MAAVEHLLSGGKSEVINLGTGNGNSVLEIIKTVEEVTGKKISLQSGPTRQGEYAKMIAAIGKAKNILGWQPKRTLIESVKTLVQWYKARPYGWKA